MATVNCSFEDLGVDLVVRDFRPAADDRLFVRCGDFKVRAIVDRLTDNGVVLLEGQTGMWTRIQRYMRSFQPVLIIESTDSATQSHVLAAA